MYKINRLLRSFMGVLGILFLCIGIILLLLNEFLFIKQDLIIFGTSTIIAGLIFLMAYQQNLQYEMYLERLKSINSSIIESMEFSLVSNSGISKVYANQSKAFFEIEKFIADTKHSVDILGITLLTLLRTSDFEETTRSALNRGVNFRVLILNPNSNAAFYLAKQENRQIESFKNELLFAKEKWCNFEGGMKGLGSFEIRYYDSLPSVTLICTDEILLITPHLYTEQIFSSPTLQIKRQGGSLFDSYINHFDVIWSNSKEHLRGYNG
jgi:hypothetical protein